MKFHILCHWHLQKKIESGSDNNWILDLYTNKTNRFSFFVICVYMNWNPEKSGILRWSVNYALFSGSHFNGLWLNIIGHVFFITNSDNILLVFITNWFSCHFSAWLYIKVSLNTAKTYYTTNQVHAVTFNCPTLNLN